MNAPETNEEIVRYFEERRSRLPIVKTTRTPSGQILDWIPIAFQHPQGKIATPPPPSTRYAGAEQTAFQPARFELDDPKVERGPQGTVPVPRKDFSRLHATTSLRRYLSKPGRDLRRRGGRGNADRRNSVRPEAPRPGDPDPFGYFHGTSSESITAFGCEAALNVWQPYVENSGDHSIMQTGLQNHDNPQLQSLEAGWEVSHDQYGDWQPHLFTYYTTNGYTLDADNVGGYNQLVTGWVQVDPNIFPGALILGLSEAGGRQAFITIKYQLIQAPPTAGNWWFQVQGIWLGYYPSSLFLGGQTGPVTLGDHADTVGFWGEVYSTDGIPATTTTQMGSGHFAEDGFGLACFQSNLQVQTDLQGTMADHHGAASAEARQLYDIVLNPPGVLPGSSFFAGGPGSLGFEARILETGTTFLQETDGVWLMADYDGDGIPDLVFIKTANTGTGTVEVHIASGASTYQTRILETGTTFLPETDGTWLMADYDGDGIPDLVFIKTANAATGTVEVHIATVHDGLLNKQ